MDWNVVGAVGEVVGAMAVVLTLLYLARQIKQNTAISLAEQNQQIMANYGEFNSIIIANRETADLLAKLEQGDLSTLAPGERVQARHLFYRLMNGWYAIQITFESGQMTRVNFESFKRDIRQIVGFYPGLLPVGTAILEVDGALDMVVFAPFAEYAARDAMASQDSE